MARPKSIDRALSDVLASQKAANKQLQEERDALETRVKEWERSELLGLAKTLAGRWLAPTVPSQRQERSIDDPVHGRVALDGKLATLLAHPIMQRLGHIRQLSFAYLEYPSAAHTRLSHSLGAARNAECALQGMLDREVYYVPGETEPHAFSEDVLRSKKDIIRKAKLLALLHDLGHGPFGHALDNYIGFRDTSLSTPKPDKRYTTLYVQKVLSQTLKSLDLDPDWIVTALDRKKRVRLAEETDHLIVDVIDSSLDVDRMDYLVRDAHMTGLTMGFTNTAALIDSMRPVMKDNRFALTYDGGARQYLEHFFLSREAMFCNCYEHPKKKAAERIFTRLVQGLLEDSSLGLSADDIFVLTDYDVLMIARGVNPASLKLRKLADELVGDLDYEVVHTVRAGRTLSIPVKEWLPIALAAKSEPFQREVEALFFEKKVTDLITGECPLPFAVKTWVEAACAGLGPKSKFAYVTQPMIWEEEIAQKSIGADRVWQIQVVVPAREVYMPPETGTNLLVKEGGRFKVVDLFHASWVMKDLLDPLNKQRQLIRVMAPAALSATERESVKQAAIAVLEQ